MSIVSMMNQSKELETVKVTIDDFTCELSVENALRLATIAKAMADGKEVAQSRSAKKSEPKKGATSKKSNKGQATHSVDVVYSVVKLNNKQFYVDWADARNTTEQRFSLGQGVKNLVKDQVMGNAMVDVEFTKGDGSKGKMARPVFTTKAKAEGFASGLKSHFEPQEINARNERLFKERNAK